MSDSRLRRKRKPLPVAEVSLGEAFEEHETEGRIRVRVSARSVLGEIAAPEYLAARVEDRLDVCVALV